LSDISSSIPVYYIDRGEFVYISNNPFLIKQSDNWSISLNEKCLFEFLTTMHPLDNSSLMLDVKIIPAGSKLEINQSGVLGISPYYEPEMNDEDQGFKNHKDFLDCLDTTLLGIAAQNKRLILPLSGGVDSRLLACRLRSLDIPFETFTYGSPDSSNSSDFNLGAKIARALGVKHQSWVWNDNNFLKM
jgi:asparagine synthase (glutamine-hydrolysing)